MLSLMTSEPLGVGQHGLDEWRSGPGDGRRASPALRRQRFQDRQEIARAAWQSGAARARTPARGSPSRLIDTRPRIDSPDRRSVLGEANVAMQSPQTSAQARRWAMTSVADQAPGTGLVRNRSGGTPGVSDASRAGPSVRTLEESSARSSMFPARAVSGRGRLGALAGWRIRMALPKGSRMPMSVP